MRNVWLVLKHEITTTLGKRSFWLMTFLFPLAILGFNLATQLATQKLSDASGSVLDDPQSAGLPIGYVDEAGLIAVIPSDLPHGLLRAFPNAQTATAALQAGEIATYLTVPADYVATGRLVVVDVDPSLFASEGHKRLARYVLNANLLGSERLARVVVATGEDSRMIGSYHQLASESETGSTSDEGDRAPGVADTMLPYAAMFILFFVLTSGGGYVLQSVSAEKENRTVEVLLVSLRPRELMLGKVIGLGAVSLLQMSVWLVAGGLLLGRGRAVLGVVANVHLPTGFAVYAVLYMLLGYLTYASALAAIGALAPSLREGAQFQILVLAPLIAPLMFNYTLLQEPNGPLAIAFSLFPLSAPVAMVMRLTMVPVPMWQVGLGLVGVAATAGLFVSLAGRFFRADTLLSKAALSMSRFRQELRRPPQG